MANLAPKPFDGKDQGIDLSDFANYQKSRKWFDGLYAESLKKDTKDPHLDLTGAIIMFPMGDGRACYIVTKNKPLTFAHIPIGDAWQAHPATIRGMNRAMVIQKLKAQQCFAAGNRLRTW